MSRRHNNQLPSNLPQLQNLIKRDRTCYVEEFKQQKERFEAILGIFLQKPGEFNKDLDELMMFLAQVSHCYIEELEKYPQHLMDILIKYSTVLNAENRLTTCKALVLMRNKQLVEPSDLLSLFFKLLNCQDKGLRKYLQTHIITDIKNINSKNKNHRLNTVLQNFMFSMMKESNVKAVKMSLNILIELYRKNVWNDAKTVNVIADACFSKVTKVMVTALQFFLCNENASSKSDNSDSEDDAPNAKEVMMANRVNKKTRKREGNLKKVQSLIKKRKKKEKPLSFNAGALHLLYDPQGFVEKLFQQIQSLNERYEVKLMTLDLISRLIGVHQLMLLNFYPYIKRFLQPHQRDVTKILQFVAQASHELVPPDALEGVLESLVNNFVTERNSGDVMAVGLNAIREICARCPLVMNKDLLQDLTQYKTYKDKSVMMASRSLIHLFRDIQPEMLHKKDKGKPTLASVEKESKRYGQVNAKDYIPGVEALVVDPSKTGEENEEDDELEDEDSESGDEEWVDVSHSEDEKDENVSEGEEEETEETSGDGTEKTGLDPLERIQMAKDLISTTILTDEDFKKMETLQVQKEIVGAKKGSAKKRKASEALNTTAAQIGELVDLAAIENIHKKRKHDREARMETVMKGREGREKFGRIKGRMNPYASTTDKEKKKNKNFMMVRHKLKRKQKKSFKERQAALRKTLMKQAKKIK